MVGRAETLERGAALNKADAGETEEQQAESLLKRVDYIDQLLAVRRLYDDDGNELDLINYRRRRAELIGEKNGLLRRRRELLRQADRRDCCGPFRQAAKLLRDLVGRVNLTDRERDEIDCIVRTAAQD